MESMEYLEVYYTGVFGRYTSFGICTHRAGIWQASIYSTIRYPLLPLLSYIAH